LPKENETQESWRKRLLDDFTFLGKKMPVNVGVVTGAISPNANVKVVSLLRIDCDGPGALAKLAELVGELPPTWAYQRGDGPKQYLFEIPTGETWKTLKIKIPGEHAELRFQAEGAQFVAPPSLHESGDVYRWVAGLAPADIPLAVAPERLCQLMRAVKPEARKRKPKKIAYQQLTPKFRAHVLEYLATKPGAISGQDGHDTAMGVARDIVYGFNLNPETGFQLLWDNYNPRCKPPWSQQELRHKVDDADQTPFDCPRGYLLDGYSLVDSLANGHSANGAPVANESAEGAPNIGTGEEPVATPKPGIGPITNGVRIGKKVIPFPMATVLETIKTATDNWPRRIGSALFVPSSDGVSWLESTGALFGFLGSETGTVDWHSATGCPTKEEVYNEQCRIATPYQAVEVLPHWPLMPGHYYACPIPEPGNGATLDAILSRFNPTTSIDRDLILSAFVSLFWGGPCGSRPAFCITSPDGRGSGKSKLAAMLGRLARGMLELSPGESSEIIRQRLLSPEGLKKRIAILDNVKSLKFSWAEFEGMITSPEISGKRLFIGEGSRPNNLTWVLTLNGPSMSEDMVQRSVVIKINRPTHVAGWEEETFGLIDANRVALIADCLGYFQRPAAVLAKFTRWSTWERDILSRLPDPLGAQKAILDRQGEINVEQEEHDLVEDYINRRLTALGYDTKTQRIRIPSEIVAKWFNTVNNEKHRTSAVSRILAQAAEAGNLKRLKQDPSRKHGRGFLWIGQDSPPDAVAFNDVQERERASQCYASSASSPSSP
jgi:hypothetical protein